jgi:hypothetical protein
MCYNHFMTKPMPVRFDTELHRLLQEGARRTPYKKQELIRLTLRRHLRTVIEQEASVRERPMTNLRPWSKKDLDTAYTRVGTEWDKLEEMATHAQGIPSFND